MGLQVRGQGRERGRGVGVSHEVTEESRVDCLGEGLCRLVRLLDTIAHVLHLAACGKCGRARSVGRGVSVGGSLGLRRKRFPDGAFS